MALPDRAIADAVNSIHALKGGKPPKRKVRVRKPKTVNLGSKGSFQIKHPGAFRAKAQAAGMSTAAYAQQKKGAPGVTGRQARSAIGLMSMGNG